jgi:hypothetical protein
LLRWQRRTRGRISPENPDGSALLGPWLLLAHEGTTNTGSLSNAAIRDLALFRWGCESEILECHQFWRCSPSTISLSRHPDFRYHPVWLETDPDLGDIEGGMGMRKILVVPPFLFAFTFAFGVAIGQEPPECIIQNGNVNADEGVDISDAIYLLNFLFRGDGAPKPQLAEDLDCVSGLRQELEVTQAELADAETNLVERNAQLAACAADLDDARKNLAIREQELSASNAALAECQATLQARESDLAVCRADLDQANQEIASRNAALVECHQVQESLLDQWESCVGQHAICNADLEETRRSLSAREAELAASNAALAECRTNLQARESELTGCTSDLEQTRQSLADREAELGECLQTEITQRTELELCRTDLDICTNQQKMPPTGQVHCYDGTGNIIDCGDFNYPGQDGFYQKGCPAEGRFIDNGDGTITDNCTKLMWQKSQVNPLSWQQALQYCENLDLAGYTDWRLPNINELITIVDRSRSADGVSQSAIFPIFNGIGCTTWSSTTYYPAPQNAWYVQFGDGHVGWQVTKNLGRCVQAVRDLTPVP